MSRVAYVNGNYLPHSQATVHIEDRGYQFADGVYEVCEIRDGRIVDAGPLEQVLTAEALGRTFGMRLELDHVDGRFAARRAHYGRRALR